MKCLKHWQTQITWHGYDTGRSMSTQVLWDWQQNKETWQCEGFCWVCHVEEQKLCLSGWVLMMWVKSSLWWLDMKWQGSSQTGVMRASRSVQTAPAQLDWVVEHGSGQDNSVLWVHIPEVQGIHTYSSLINGIAKGWLLSHVVIGGQWGGGHVQRFPLQPGKEETKTTAWFLHYTTFHSTLKVHPLTEFFFFVINLLLTPFMPLRHARQKYARIQITFISWCTTEFFLSAHTQNRQLEDWWEQFAKFEKKKIGLDYKSNDTFKYYVHLLLRYSFTYLEKKTYITNITARTTATGSVTAMAMLVPVPASELSTESTREVKSQVMSIASLLTYIHTVHTYIQQCVYWSMTTTYLLTAAHSRSLKRKL